MASILTPANTTLGDLKTEVANFVKIPGTTKGLALAGAKIKSAVRRMNIRTWAFLLTKEDVDISTPAREYQLTTRTIKEPRTATLLDADDKPTRLLLTFLTPMEMPDVEDDSTVTMRSPEYYTFYNMSDDATMTLNVTPGAAFVSLYPTVRLRYYRMVQIPATDNDYFTVPSYAEDFILWRAKYEIALDEDPEKAMIAKKEATEAWDLLVDFQDDFMAGHEAVDLADNLDRSSNYIYG